MNLYFLVEGRRSESKVYPKWLEYILPDLKRVYAYDEVDKNNYYLVSGEGYPLIYRHLKNAVSEVNDVPQYNYLVLCLDADDAEVEERIEAVYKYLNEENISLSNCELKIVVQNRCLETWFLGNRVVYPRQPVNPRFIEYARYFNVSEKDPEAMGLYKKFRSISLFHFSYLREMLAERGIRYSKQRPREVVEPHYVDQLKDRVNDTTHLRSLKDFFDFCRMVSSNMEEKI